MMIKFQFKFLINVTERYFVDECFINYDQINDEMTFLSMKNFLFSESDYVQT